MSPGLNSDHHYLVVPTTSWEEESQDRDRRERVVAKASGKKNLFRRGDGLEWGGYVAEEAFALVYPDMIPISSAYNTNKKDFKSNKSGLRYDIKCRISAEDPFKDHFNAFINDYQVEKTEADIFVCCFFFIKSPYIRLCGWLYKSQVKGGGELIRVGDKSWVKADVWTVPYKSLNSMHLLPE